MACIWCPQAAGALAHMASLPAGWTALLQTQGLLSNLVKLLESQLYDVKLAAVMALSALSSGGESAGRLLAKESALTTQIPQLLECPHGQVQAYALVLLGNMVTNEESARTLATAEHLNRLIALVNPATPPNIMAGLPNKRLGAAGALHDNLRCVIFCLPAAVLKCTPFEKFGHCRLVVSSNSYSCCHAGIFLMLQW